MDRCSIDTGEGCMFPLSKVGATPVIVAFSGESECSKACFLGDVGIKSLIFLISDSIDTNTQLVLANAIYFKGLWETMFKPESTTNKQFQLSNGQRKSLPFMSLRSSFRCGSDASINSLVAVLPFEVRA